jgi:CubicO group peptidase (beta-lactamase class C family)
MAVVGCMAMRRVPARWLLVISWGIVACENQESAAATVANSSAAGDMRGETNASAGQAGRAELGPATSPAAASAAAAGTESRTMPNRTVSGSQSVAAAGNGGDPGGSSAQPGGSAGVGAGTGGAGMPSTANMPNDKWPIAPDGWPLASPADFGLDKDQLDTIAGALQNASRNTRAGLVVVKEGVLVYEKYWQGGAADKRVIYSCTKSWGSTLIGIAVRQGLIMVEDPVTKWVPQPAAAIGEGALIKHLLTQTAHTTPPGQAFAYNSGSIINTLPEVLEAASKMSSHAFYEAFLAKPLQLTMDWPRCGASGCTGTRYKADYIQFGDGGPNPVLQSNVRDQAKLGWLWANDGVWNGERLLDSSYIQAATQPSFDFQALYGYLWWLNRDGPGVGPRGARLTKNAEAPNEMFRAVGGVGHCLIAVFPTQRMVIAHIGDMDSGNLGGHLELFAPLYK